MNMDWIIGPLLMTLGYLFYVVVPLAALWFIARGQKKTRIIVSIVSAVAIAVLAFSTGISAAHREMTRRYYDEFIRPFTMLIDRLQTLSDQGDGEAVKAEIKRLSDAEITATSNTGNTNTLWQFIDE